MSLIETLTKESVVTHYYGVISSDVDNETILLSIENNKYYGMVLTANRIWNMLTTPIPIAKIIETLLEEYDISKEQCEKEVFEFLGDLLANNLITVQK